MSQLGATYRWSATNFLRAHDAGAFEGRVELVEGEVWPVVIGDWHGEAVFRIAAALRQADAVVTSSTLPSGESLPDPDCWVRRRGAVPRGELGKRLSLWRADDVLLVVEVSDDTVFNDLTVKARVYGSAGYPVFWVVSPDKVYVHTGPIPGGYARREEYLPADRLPVPYADIELRVDHLVGEP